MCVYIYGYGRDGILPYMKYLYVSCSSHSAYIAIVHFFLIYYFFFSYNNFLIFPFDVLAIQPFHARGHNTIKTFSFMTVVFYFYW